jgi:predicted unusual protein kinase regulating ubiquinone biosynthesis (AarF/ABC1/UbiB family)
VDAAAKHSAEVLGNLRGLAAKIGQTASYVDGFIPPDQRDAYEKALSKLQRATMSSEPDQVRRTILEDLGKEPEFVFSEFDENPVASASIGQVHRARLHDGRQVAVKVQHPGIEAAVESDLSNLSMLEGVINLAGPRGLQAGKIFDEVLLRFRQELDYRIEARNQMAFRALHEGDPLIRVPEVFELASSRRVLTSAWVDGITLEQATRQPEEIRVLYAQALWRFVFRGNLLGGAFNADPHPGNYVFHPDGTVTFLDFGCVQPIPNRIRRAAIDAHRAAMERDLDSFAGAISRMLGTKGGEFGEATRRYTLRCFEPLMSSPYRVTSAYATQLFGEVRAMKKSMGAKDRSFVPPPPELALMNRLQFGFYSVVAKFDVAVDYAAVERGFLDEAAALEVGRLKLD